MTNEEARKEIQRWLDGCPWADTKEAFELAINALKERPQGKWVYRQEWFDDEKEPRMTWGCNRCGFSIKSVHEKRNFCPNCGTDMGGDTE